MKKVLIKGAMALLLSSYSMIVSAEDKTITLMLDWFVNPNHGPVVVAQQKGYFKEEGLNITIQEPACINHY